MRSIDVSVQKHQSDNRKVYSFRADEPCFSEIHPINHRDDEDLRLRAASRRRSPLCPRS
jgi:hypothetical protein